MKSNGRFFSWPGPSSSGVDPVVSSHTRQCGHFTGCTKINKEIKKNKTKQNKTNKRKPNNRGRKEETGKRGFTTAKLRKGKSGTFKHSSTYLLWLCESPTQLPKMLTHLAIALCLDSMLWTDCLSALDWPLQSLTLNWQTLLILLFSRNFGKELVILFHRSAAAPFGHEASIIKKSPTGDSLSFGSTTHNC